MGGSVYNYIYALYAAGVILSGVCVYLTFLQKPSEEQKITLLLTVLCSAIWIGFYGSLLSDSKELLVYANKIRYLGACNVYFVIFLFYIRYYHLHVTRWTKYGLFTLSLVLTLLTLTFDHHTLFYKSYEVEISNGVPSLSKDYAFGHNLYVGMVILYTVLFLYFYVRKVRNDKAYDRFNSFILLMVILVPSFLYILEKIVEPVMEYVPFGMLTTIVFLIYLVAGEKICDINILARELMFDSIDDALVVVDDNLKYKGCNTRAKDIFPELDRAKVNSSVDVVSREIQKLLENQIGAYKKEKYLEHQDRVFHPRLKLVTGCGNRKGYVLWLEDVTTQRESQKLVQNYQRDLELDVKKKTGQLQKMQEQMVYGFAALVENKNLVTGGHIKRTSAYVLAIAKELKKEGLFLDTISYGYLEKLKLVAPLHDIGKVAIPERILDKPGRLTESEFEIIKTHSAHGAQIIDYTMGEMDDREYFQMAWEVARYHHERWDGTGYPEGLSGDAIPLAARIMAVADVFDALVSERPYKRAFSMERAFAIIEEESGRHFDPLIVEAFLQIKEKIGKLQMRFCDEVSEEENREEAI